MDDEAMFTEVLAASAILDEMPDASRADTWVSSALGLWADNLDSAGIDQEFLEWLANIATAKAERLALGVSRLLDPSSTQVRATEAWSVTLEGMTSIGVGFVADDGSEHSLLADVAEGQLQSLVAAPASAELFGVIEGEVAHESQDVFETCRAIAQGWDGLVRAGTNPPEDMLANLALGRARLEVVLGDVSRFGRVTTSMVSQSPRPERDPEADAWALGVLDGAGVGAGTEPGDLVAVPIDASEWERHTEAEREAFAALEWADWLGVALELHRTLPGTIIDATGLVDMVNRSPEVTSSIPKNDRGYYEWVFSMVLSVWMDAGLIDADGALSADGSDRLIGALRKSWSAG
ncbi:MAG: hypothetical protein ACR2PK_00695 [Acidimicrobiales bacterium]